MKKILTAGIIILFLAVWLLIGCRKKVMKIDMAQTIKVESLVFKNNDLVPVRYTCDGENVNPPLTISTVPEGAKSLVLIVDDPDSSAGIFTHWLVWNIDPTTKEIKENSVPYGAMEGLTTWGTTGYGGPCPHVGTHHYVFKILALDESFVLPTTTNVDELIKMIQKHILAQGEIVGVYGKK